MMDIGSLRFAPSALAAACLYHFSSEDLALECSGFKLPEISPAIRLVTRPTQTDHSYLTSEIKYILDG